MPGPGVPRERPQIRHHHPPDRVQVEVADEFEKGGRLLHHEGLVPVLEEMADAVMPPVERAGIAREEGPYAPG